jgi:hypothetical protein
VVEEWFKMALFSPQTPQTPSSPRSLSSSHSASFFSPPPPEPTAAPPPVPLDGFQPSLAFVNQMAAQRGIIVNYTASSTGPPHNPVWEVRCHCKFLSSLCVISNSFLQSMGKNVESERVEVKNLPKKKRLVGHSTVQDGVILNLYPH